MDLKKQKEWPVDSIWAEAEQVIRPMNKEKNLGREQVGRKQRAAKDVTRKRPNSETNKDNILRNAAK